MGTAALGAANDRHIALTRGLRRNSLLCASMAVSLVQADVRVVKELLVA